MTIFFTADHHFGHENIIKLCGRPFKNADEMTRVMVERWNAIVKPDDSVYHLGDMFSFKPREMDERTAFSIAKSLNGGITLFRGNHDSVSWLHRVVRVSSSPYAIMTASMHTVVMFHYPIEEWDGFYRGAIHLHGHTHGTLKHKIKNRFDVGVDCFGFQPVTLEQILASAP